MAFATALAACRNVAMFPFTKYNQLLDKHPWKTKCVTSAFMYGAGDLCAQKAEHYNKSKEAEEKGEDAPGFHIDWSRAGVFFTFGLLVGGPAYTAWFARLDMLPAQLWALRNARQRAEIMRAYNLLKRHGIDVNLRMDRLPDARPLGKWTGKAFKIAADQFIFSTTYTLVFFLAIGMMQGGVAKYKAESKMHGIDEWSAEIHSKFGRHGHGHGHGEHGHSGSLSPSAAAAATAAIGGPGSPVNASDDRLGQAVGQGRVLLDDGTDSLVGGAPVAGGGGAGGLVAATPRASGGAAGAKQRALEKNLMALRSAQLSQEDSDEAIASIDRVLEMLREEESKNVKSWKAIWEDTWEHTKQVYWKTYVADCVVWPPLQLINFTFVPLRLQVLYINACNLAWNTFLSMMASGH